MTAAVRQDQERVELKGRQAVSRTTIHGWPSFIFGIPFAGAGAAVLMIYTGHIQVSPSKIHAPLWIIGVFGLLFLLAGLSFMWHGAIGLSRRARVEAAQAGRASSPWLWDYEWQALGITDNKFKKVIHAVIMLVVMGAFLAPFNWWAFASNEGGTMVTVMVVIFDLIFGLACGYYLFRNLALYLKYGNSRLRFNNFPFLLGDKLAVTLTGLPGEIRQLQLDLRFIEERYETRGSGKNRQSVVVCYQLFLDSRSLSGREVSQSGNLAVDWPLPDQKEWTTTLSQRPPRYWELEVKADTPGVDYHSRFLLPVYTSSTC